MVVSVTFAALRDSCDEQQSRYTGVMSKSPNARRVGGPLSWEQLARPDTEQCQRFLAESLSLLLGDVLRAILSDASPSLAADELSVERYRNLADSLADGESRRRTGGVGLFPALFDSDPSARSRRARLTWLLTHDRRLDASTREAATALIEACEHLGVLLWPDAETA